jgi:hypothetical protein
MGRVMPEYRNLIALTIAFDAIDRAYFEGRSAPAG